MFKAIYAKIKSFLYRKKNPSPYLLPPPVFQQNIVEPSAVDVKAMIQTYLDNFQLNDESAIELRYSDKRNFDYLDAEIADFLPTKKILGQAGVIVYETLRIRYYAFSMSYVDVDYYIADIKRVLNAFKEKEGLVVSGYDLVLINKIKRLLHPIKSSLKSYTHYPKNSSLDE
jgi:hypothetical protein